MNKRLSKSKKPENNVDQKESNEWKDSAILFVDVVSFSEYNEHKQKYVYNYLWESTKEILLNYQELQDYIIKSTGDGVLLITFNPNMDLLEVAKYLQKKLKGKRISLRQGLNCGRVSPINEGKDAIGDPINMCQRIMDCGDKNHILVSDHYIAVKVGNRPPRDDYHDIGEFTVKHEKTLRLFNYYSKQYGNNEFPQDLTLLLPELKLFCSKGKWKSLLSSCKIVDLSHEICNELSCSFAPQVHSNITTDTIKGQSVGVEFITTLLGNLPMNYGTHIDFPGHLSFGEEITSRKKVGEYLLDTFIVEAIVVDVRDKINKIQKYINDEGYINYKRFGKGKRLYENFVKIIRSMEIDIKDFLQKVGKNQALAGKAILFYTGLDCYWKYKCFEHWKYAYFFNPYISPKLADYLIKQKIALVGIDALQIENPMINLGGREKDDILWQGYKEFIEKELSIISTNFIHKKLLENDIMIVENLTELKDIIGQKVLFVAVPLKLEGTGCTDNSITRAFALVFRNI